MRGGWDASVSYFQPLIWRVGLPGNDLSCALADEALELISCHLSHLELFKLAVDDTGERQKIVCLVLHQLEALVSNIEQGGFLAECL
ncbi:unnamed protein product [Dibothriocephalus latus]|uniref:Uncharacterized protein n=1 Tax=Dibothriocephalus latus TaxID=60516 RepID=A0A3P6T9L7_DIBLA|nr:unnamed protein product [Dibothriocephalus latus]